MKMGKTKRQPRAPQVSTRSLTARLHSERDRLFKAMSIIACCRLATASLNEPSDDREVMTDALQAAYDLIGATTGQLQLIGDESKAT
jgi:hypothetical protein